MLKYDTNLKQLARKLRTDMTDAERLLWSRLRGKQVLGVQFYRQKPIGPYIVDFHAPASRLVIEVDGSLRPCYFLPTMGRVKHESLAQAINSPEAIDLRREYRLGERSECERCVCPLYKGGRSLLQL